MVKFVVFMSRDKSMLEHREGIVLKFESWEYLWANHDLFT